MALLAGLVGLASSLAAIGFRSLVKFIQTLCYGSGGDLLDMAQAIPWYGRFWLPALGGLVVGPLVYFLAREAKGHGVPEVMEAVVLRSGVIKKRAVLIKAFSAAVSVGTGGSAGTIGPIVHLGSGIGSNSGQILRISVDRVRTLVGCGAAAGIAATFNAPIAGCMFALEIILGDFGLAIFSPIVISSVVATAVSRHFLGDTPAFIVPSYQLVTAWELPLYALLGFICAGMAVAFTYTLYRTEDVFARIGFPEYTKAMLGGLSLGVLALPFPHVLGEGFPVMDIALLGDLSWMLMLVLVAVKILATSLTIGSGGSGGVFAPALFMGAMAGGSFGQLVHTAFPHTTASSGAYSIVGMGAVMAGTSHGPLTAILMLFEMTGDYLIILPLMIACIISSVASGQFLKESIYTMKLARKGVNIKAGKEVNVLKSMLVRDTMNPDVETVQENLNLGKLAEKISKSKYNSFPVVDGRGHLKGILSYLDYHDVLYNDDLKDLIVAKELATLNVVTISSDDNLYTALQKITAKDFSILPVVSSSNPMELLGVITRRDIMGAYNKAVIKKTVLSE